MQELETKTGQSPESQATEAGPVLSRCGLRVIWQQKHIQTKALKPNIRSVTNPLACGKGEVFIYFPQGKSLFYLHLTVEIPLISVYLRTHPF